MAEAKHTTTPWRVVMDSIFAGEMRVCDVRGWGYLTGQGSGALGLSAREAEAIQKANAQLIVTAVNERSALLKCEAALRAHAEWFGKEGDGPAYPPGTDRYSEGGEAVWRAWWDEQLELCRRANDLTRSALSLLDEARNGK